MSKRFALKLPVAAPRIDATPNRKNNCIVILQEKYDRRLIDEYVLFAENRGGKDVWDTFDGPPDLYHDIELFREALAIVVDEDFDE